MQEDICLHSINTNCEAYRAYKNVQVLSSILRVGALLSKRQRCISNPTGFNGLDYISLCDYQKRKEHTNHYPFYNAYESYISNSISFVFPKDKLDIIVPKMIDISSAKEKYFETMCRLGMLKCERYSDLPDEIQVADIIPLELMIGLTFPLNKVHIPFYSPEMTTKTIINDLKKIKALLIKYSHDVPIYEINTMEELKDETTVKKLVNKYY